MKTFLTVLLSGLLILAGCTPSTRDSENEASEASSAADEEMQLNGIELSYTNGNITMNGYLVKDQGVEGKRPGVLVVHEWWGHNEHSRIKAEELAKLGYTALAVDMYGDGKTADHPQDAQAFAMQVNQNMDEARSRFMAALKALKEDESVDTTKIGAIGFCFGGGIVLQMASMGADLDAVASFHGTLNIQTLPTADQLKANILVANGAEDPFVTQEQIDAFNNAMAAIEGVDYTFLNLEGAVHAFTNPGADLLGSKFELPLAYNKEADEQSWEAMKNLFEASF